MEKTWIVKISKSVLKDLDGIDTVELSNIKKAIYDLEENPFPVGVKKLKGQKFLILRIRRCKYRIVYQINIKDSSIIVLSVSHRKDAYK